MTALKSRIFVEKRPEFRTEAESLRRELNSNLGLDIRSLRLLCVYDLFGFTPELIERSSYRVFGAAARSGFSRRSRSLRRASTALMQYFEIRFISSSPTDPSKIIRRLLLISISADGSMSLTHSSAEWARWSNCPGRHSTARYGIPPESEI